MNREFLIHKIKFTVFKKSYSFCLDLYNLCCVIFIERLPRWTFIPHTYFIMQNKIVQQILAVTNYYWNAGGTVMNISDLYMRMYIAGFDLHCLLAIVDSNIFWYASKHQAQKCFLTIVCCNQIAVLCKQVRKE